MAESRKSRQHSSEAQTSYTTGLGGHLLAKSGREITKGEKGSKSEDVKQKRVLAPKSVLAVPAPGIVGWL